MVALRRNSPLLSMALAVLLLGSAGGCHQPIPIITQFQGNAEVAARAIVEGEMALKLPAAADSGPIAATVVQPARGTPAPRIALIDVDGLLLSQGKKGLPATGDNPVADFREKLEAASRDPSVAAVVLRINSPGGSVTACDILASELERFRVATGKPVVACLMEVATSGALYLAVGADRVVAHPTTLTGGVGVLFNHVDLRDAMAQLNVTADPVKAGERIDMGSVTQPLAPDTKDLLQEMADGFHTRFLDRIAARRPLMTAEGRALLEDGRILAAPQALAIRLVDGLGYLPDALVEARSLAGLEDAEVVLLHRESVPARSIYATAPVPSQLADALPFSYPGLDRGKLPTFLYLWQPDPTIPRIDPQ